MAHTSSTACAIAVLVATTAVWPAVHATLVINAPAGVEPRVVDAVVQLYNQAVSFQRRRAYDDAIRLYKQALEYFPFNHALINLGDAYMAIGQDDLAKAALLKCIEVSAHDPGMQAGAYNNLGLLVSARRASEVAVQEEAIKYFKAGTEADPTYIASFYNWALALEAQGRWEAALAMHARVLQQDPGHSGALLGTGSMLYRRGDYVEAVRYYRRAANSPTVSAHDKYTANANTAAILASTDGGHEMAVEFTAQLIADNQRNNITTPVRITFLNVQARREVAMWRHLADMEDDVLATLEAGCEDVAPLHVTPYDLLLYPVCQRLSACVAASYGRDLEVTDKAFPPQQPVPPAAQWRAPDDRLHVAYVSYDLREHPIGWMVHALLLAHDRRTSVVSGYHYGTVRPDLQQALTAAGVQPFHDLVDMLAQSFDPVVAAAHDLAPHSGGQTAVDALPRGWGSLYDTFLNVSHTVRLARAADHFFYVEAVDDAAVATHMVAGGVDVFVDLMAHTTGTRVRIPTTRPAPIVVNYLGYPGTSGLFSVDFAIVDRIVAPPEGEGAVAGTHVPGIAGRRGVGQQWTEGLVYMPVTYQANTYPPQQGICPRPGGNCDSGRNVDGRLVVANFNSGHKLEPVVFRVWMSVLQRFPRAVLWLLERRAEAAQGHLLATAAAYGVSPSRIVFLPKLDRDVHLRRLHEVDLFLDTHLYTAHSTASDVLWTGTPLVTVASASFQGRVAASVMHAAGVPLLVTYSVKEYESVVTRLLARPRLLSQFRRFLLLNNFKSSLFDAGRHARSVQRAYQCMWDVRMTQLRLHRPFSTSPVFPTVTSPPECVAHARGDPVALRRCLVGWWPFSIIVDPMQRHEVLAPPPVPLKEDAPLPADTPWLALHMYHRASEALQAGYRAVVAGNVQAAHATAWRVLHAWDDNHVPARLLYGWTLTWPLEQFLGYSRANSSQALCATGLDVMRTSAAHLPAAQLWLSTGSSDLPPPPPPPQDRTDADYRLPVFWKDAALMKLMFEQAVHRCARLLATSGSTLPRLAAPVNTTWFALSSDFGRAGMAEHHLAAQWMAVAAGHTARRSPDTLAAAAAGFVARPPGVPVVAFYCEEYGQTWWPGWGPWDIHRGLGGSEEAVVYLTRQLAAAGRFHVEVYTDPSAAHIGVHDGVAYYPTSWYDATARPADVFIAWRYPVSLALARNARVAYVWVHDVIDVTALVRPWVAPVVSRVVFQSAYHAASAPAWLVDSGKATVMRHGLEATGFVDGPNPHNVFVYTSSPSRGLEQVLLQWSKIYNALGGNAVLRVFYGFTAGFVRHTRAQPSGDQWLDGMQRLLRQPGVEYVGMVDHAALATAYANAGFFLYPTSYPETGCVALMKAMAMGAIPITSRYMDSVVGELVAEFGLGPPARPRRISGDPAWLAEWSDAVVAAASTANLTQHRTAMKAWARREFRWDERAEAWTDMMLRDLSTAPPPHALSPRAALAAAVPEWVE